MTKVEKEKQQRLFREEGDAIQGDRIYVRCQKYTDWKLFTKSDQHRGSNCILKKDAYAKIEKAFTNIQK